MVVQAKFFSGALIFTPEEKEVLKAWIREKGRERMEKLFCEEILRHKPKGKELYSNSPLAELLQAA